jgi:hypothetical protein
MRAGARLIEGALEKRKTSYKLIGRKGRKREEARRNFYPHYWGFVY